MSAEEDKLKSLIDSQKIAANLLLPLHELRYAENDRDRWTYLEVFRSKLQKYVKEIYQSNLTLAYTFSGSNAANGENKILRFKQAFAQAVLDEISQGYDKQYELLKEDKDYIMTPYSNAPSMGRQNPYLDLANFN